MDPLTDSGGSATLPANQAAFDEVLSAHGAVAWGLAQAITTDLQMARRVAREGLVRAARQAGNRPGSVPRGVVLAGVWSSAAETLSEGGGGGRLSGPGRAELTLASQYSSLPERWRASIWLSAVVGSDNSEMGAVLGVPPSFAAALVRRSTEALRGRMEAAGATLPARLGPALAPLAGEPPADLGAEPAEPAAPDTTADTGSIPALGAAALDASEGAAVVETDGRKSRADRRAEKAEKAQAEKAAKAGQGDAALLGVVAAEPLADDIFAPPPKAPRAPRSGRRKPDPDTAAMAELGALEGAEFWGDKPAKPPKAAKPPKEPREPKEPKPPRDRQSRKDKKIAAELAFAGAGAGGLFLEDPGPAGPLPQQEKRRGRVGRPIGVGLLCLVALGAIVLGVVLFQSSGKVNSPPPKIASGAGGPTSSQVTVPSSTATTPISSPLAAASATTTPVSATQATVKTSTGATPTTVRSGTSPVTTARPSTPSGTTTPPATGSGSTSATTGMNTTVNNPLVSAGTSADGASSLAVAPASGTPAVQVNLGCSSGVGVNLLGIQLGCQESTPGASSTSTPPTDVVSALATALGG